MQKSIKKVDQNIQKSIKISKNRSKHPKIAQNTQRPIKTHSIFECWQLESHSMPNSSKFSGPANSFLNALSPASGSRKIKICKNLPKLNRQRWKSERAFAVVAALHFRNGSSPLVLKQHGPFIFETTLHAWRKKLCFAEVNFFSPLCFAWILTLLY